MRFIEKLQREYREFPYTFYPLSPQVNIFHNHGIGQNEEMNDGILLGINYSLYLGFTSVSTSSVPRSNPGYHTAFSTIILTSCTGTQLAPWSTYDWYDGDPNPKGPPRLNIEDLH